MRKTIRAIKRWAKGVFTSNLVLVMAGVALAMAVLILMNGAK